MSEKKEKECPTCGTKNDIEVSSCKVCGRRLEQPIPIYASKKIFKKCAICHATNDPANLSCQKCGHMLGDVPNIQPGTWSKVSISLLRRRLGWVRLFPVLIVVIFLIVLVPFLSSKIITRELTPAPNLSATPSLPASLGTITTSGGEAIGVNDGSYAPFDLGRARQEVSLKQQAAQKLRTGDSQAAISLWQEALGVESNDAEALIYAEDQRVLTSGNSYVTLIVGVAFTAPFPDVASESVLQGVYVAQHEYNDSHFAGVQLRILIANSGSDVTDTTAIAQQIVRIANRDKTVIGVIGWLHSANSLTAISVLAQVRIPMISPQSTSDALSGISPYFFRVVSPNHVEAQVATQFAENTLHATRPVIFLDPSDVYSQNLAQDFKDQFAHAGYPVLREETFTTDKTGTGQFSALIQDAEKYHPDVFIFTSASNADAANFQDALPTSGLFAHLSVLAGSGSYTAHRNSYGRWYFAASAFHGANNTSITQKFAQEYIDDFNQHNQHNAGSYSYTLADDHAILSYDATSVFLLAIQTAYASGKSTLTPQNLAQVLPQITFQGVSGQITFGSNHDPINKVVFILSISNQGYIQLQHT